MSPNACPFSVIREIGGAAPFAGIGPAHCLLCGAGRGSLLSGRGPVARHAPQDALARLGVRAAGPLGVRRTPSSSTIRRLLTLVCPGGLANLLGCDPAGSRHLAVDGKAARGSRTDTGLASHLLSAVLVGGRTVSQLRVPDKTNEVTSFTKLLSPFDLAGVVVVPTPCTPTVTTPSGWWRRKGRTIWSSGSSRRCTTRCAHCPGRR